MMTTRARRRRVWREPIVFVTNPALRRWHVGRFELVEGLVVTVGGLRFVVPAGFVTDGASVPPIFWPVVGHPYSPSSLRAAILHDYLCRLREASGLESRSAHLVFYSALRAEGVALPRAAAMTVAVLLFGPEWHLV